MPNPLYSQKIFNPFFHFPPYPLPAANHRPHAPHIAGPGNFFTSHSSTFRSSLQTRKNFCRVYAFKGKFFHTSGSKLFSGKFAGAPGRLSARVGYMQYIHTRGRVPLFTPFREIFSQNLATNLFFLRFLAQKAKYFLTLREIAHTIKLLFLSLCEVLCEA